MPTTTTNGKAKEPVIDVTVETVTVNQPEDTPIESSPSDPNRLDKLLTALIKARSAFDRVSKDAKNPHFKSDYATLDSFLKAVDPALLENGLFLNHTVEEKETGGYVLRTWLYHVSEQFMSMDYPIAINTAKPQEIGSQITYARRYSVGAILGVAAEKDDDGNAAQTSFDSRFIESVCGRIMKIGTGEQLVAFWTNELPDEYRKVDKIVKVKNARKKELGLE